MKGVTTASFGLLSLNGLPMNPHTTGPFTPGMTLGPAWMWALVRLSLVSAVWAPVKSMLLAVAVTVIAVEPALMAKWAVPNDAFRRAPPDSVGLVGCDSCPLVMLTTKSLGEMPALASRLSTY